MGKVIVSVLALLGVSLCACAARVRLIGDANFPTSFAVGESRFGGISGLARRGGQWLAVSDDRSMFGPARLYPIDLAVGKDSLAVTPRPPLLLRGKKGESFAKGTVDFEGIAILGKKNFVLSGELPLPGEAAGSFLGIFDLSGNLVRPLNVPAKFLPDGRNKRGIRRNKGFESLALSPDGADLYSANEAPLMQDTCACVRLLRYRRQGGAFVAAREYAYPLRPAGKWPSFVRELLVQDQDTLLALEVSWNKETRQMSAWVYKVHLKGATDVSRRQALAELPPRALGKELLIDLRDFVGELSPGWQSLDNLEGMAFGPPTAQGNPTLILISDNNFNPLQRTQVLAFELMNRE